MEMDRSVWQNQIDYLLADVVVEAEIFPKILNCLKDIDPLVRKNAATCIREIAK